MVMSVRLFEEADHAECYSASRPGYPGDLVDFVIQQVKESIGTFDLALDVGCGSGQNTALFAKHFKKVIGTDISESQLKEARRICKDNHVEYICTPAESLPVPDNSVDLITCAASFHWFDEVPFFKEVERILKPGGCIAMYVYYPRRILGSEELNDMFDEVYWKKVIPYQNPCVHKARDHGYLKVSLPFPFQIRRTDFKMTIRQPLEVTLALHDSFSFYRSYRKDHPDDDIIETLRQRCKEYVDKHEGACDDDFDVTLSYDFLLTRKPGGIEK